jgi:hypothetical protein
VSEVGVDFDVTAGEKKTRHFDFPTIKSCCKKTTLTTKTFKH